MGGVLPDCPAQTCVLLHLQSLTASITVIFNNR